MVTTANYLLRANVSNSDFYFEYADCGDVWTALEQFWHDDYPEVLPEHDGSPFPITVTALDGNGEACGQHTLTFNSAAFHAFYDHGRKASGPYTLDEFALDVCHHSGPVANPVQQAKDIIALWSDWCMDYDDENLWLDYMVRHPKAHCNRQHLQQKWDCCYEKYGSKAAMQMFWRELDNDNRTILTEYVTTEWHKD